MLQRTKYDGKYMYVRGEAMKRGNVKRDTQITQEAEVRKIPVKK